MDQQHLAVSKRLLDAHTLLCQAIMPLIMQISTLLVKLLRSLPAFLSRKDIMILFNWKEMTCNIFLLSSLSKMCFQLSPLLGMKAEGNPRLEGQQGKRRLKKSPLVKSRKVIPPPPSPDLSTVRTALTPCDLLPTPREIQGAKGTKGTAQPTYTKSQPAPEHVSRSCPGQEVTELNIYPTFIHFGSRKSHSLRILSSGQWRESQGSVYSRTLIRVMNVSHKQKHF